MNVATDPKLLIEMIRGMRAAQKKRLFEATGHPIPTREQTEARRRMEEEG